MSRIKCLKPRLATSTKASGWKPDTIRGNRHQRGYGTEWEHTRERILERDNGLCQPHLRKGEVQLGDQVDHVVSKADARALGWTEKQIEDDTNLQCICEPCHREKTSREAGRRGGG